MNSKMCYIYLHFKTPETMTFRSGLVLKPVLILNFENNDADTHFLTDEF